ncbi:LLM class flavin-dependent oxidoreductase [Amycolatopsis sp. NPDC051903]|uniref:LLM class flavin-dependent oxidoreductase n=1 Tax=Amycolatopsis sp. NPDC051903 TaxID=3363936 RepID=UPI0037A66702
MAYLAANTRSVAYTPNVANLGLRSPTMLAKSAATLSRLLGGRLVLGVGAGHPEGRSRRWAASTGPGRR